MNQRPQSTPQPPIAQAGAAKEKTSGTAIASFVLGILAAFSSFIPIVNNISFVLGIIGLVFAAIGMKACCKGSRSGKSMAIAGLVLNIAAIAITLAIQSFFVAILG